MSVVGTSGVHQGRRLGDRRKSEEKAVGVTGAKSVLVESVTIKRVSGNEEDHREAWKGHRKLLVWDQDGSCHDGRTLYIGKVTMFVESAWMAPVDSEVTISVVPKEGDVVGQELAKGMVVWHCTQDDEFKNRAGFGVLLRNDAGRTDPVRPL